MGKSKGAVNTKVEAANAKKAGVKAAKDAKKNAELAAAEAADWSQGANARGAKKKEEDERKRQEAEARKAELKKLQAMEEHELAKVEDKTAIRKNKTKDKKELNKPWEEALKPVVKKNNKGSRATSAPATNSNKTTLFEIQKAMDAENAKKAASNKSGIKFETSYGENRNRDESMAEARSIEAALDVLTVGDKDLEKHPERRAKAVSEERSLLCSRVCTHCPACV